PGGFGGDEVLHEHLVLEDTDLGHDALAVAPLLLAHDHDAVHGLAAGEELGLGQDGLTTASGLATVATPLTLGLEAGGAGDALHLVGRRAGALSPASGPATRLALVDLGVGRVVARGLGLVGAGTPTATTTTATPPRTRRGV